MAEEKKKIHCLHVCGHIGAMIPSEEKVKMMKELMEAIEHAQLVHSNTILRAKQEESGLKRHPSTLSHMHHDDSDSEPEVEEDKPHPKEIDTTDTTDENLTTDPVETNAADTTAVSDDVKTTEPVETNAVDTAAVSDEVKTTEPVETNAVDTAAVSDEVNQTNAAP
ncbi:uncharacterized protein LOC132744486 isoform X2 [Ruditapes philippinarum]|uniref:uncharacterized protein LOC132744486 isoform X2 n=1 Tax=Ruditapes philippinarum TaxID=129788 RepID=UPI00295AA605|nr:uncharacterized protein LOC132744486 isoform X2 [Ruditapes philippinarum]